MTAKPPPSSDLPDLHPALDENAKVAMRNSMRLEWRDPRTLNPHKKNWKSHLSTQREAYSDFKEEVGWAGALLFNEQTGNLLDGHMRLQDALENNEEEVPVLIVDVDPDTELKILAFLDLVGSLFKTRQSALSELDALAQSRSDLLRSLARGEAFDDDDPFAEVGETADPGLPEGGLSLVLGESYNYVVLLFRTEMDFVAAQDHFGLQRTRCAFNSGIGVGRVIDGGDYLKGVYRNRLGLITEEELPQAGEDGDKGDKDGDKAGETGDNLVDKVVDKGAADELD